MLPGHVKLKGDLDALFWVSPEGDTVVYEKSNEQTILLPNISGELFRSLYEATDSNERPLLEEVLPDNLSASDIESALSQLQSFGLIHISSL